MFMRLCELINNESRKKGSYSEEQKSTVPKSEKKHLESLYWEGVAQSLGRVDSVTLWRQHARLPCPSPAPRARSHSCPSSRALSHHLRLRLPLLLPSVLPSLRVSSKELALHTDIYFVLILMCTLSQASVWENPSEAVLLFSHFCRWGKWSPEKLSNFLKHT